jgi:hypothetical protein
MNTHDHIPRYFCRHAQRDRVVQWDELIYAPQDDRPLDGELDGMVWARPWSAFARFRSMVILGPPRQGKTTEFEYQAARVENGFLLELRNVIDPRKPPEGFAPETEQRWKQWLASELPGELFIDAVDEGKLDAPKLVGYLVVWLRSLDPSVLVRLRVHLSCREADWSQIEEGTWQDLFAPATPEQRGNYPPYIVLALLDLDHTGIRAYCVRQGVDPDVFLSGLPAPAHMLLRRPQTLRMLVAEYRDTGKHSGDLRELYECALQIQLQEQNEYRLASHASGLSVLDKRSIAEHVAVSARLSGREIIAVHGVDLAKHVPVGLSGPLDAERAVLSTQVFEPYVSGQFRFADPAVADYLAACRLAGLVEAGAVPADKLVALFFGPPDAASVTPILRDLAGWVCALSVPLRRRIIRRDPGVVLHDYVGSLSDDDRVSVWRWVVEQYGTRKWFDGRELTPHMGQLACEAVTEDLRRVLRDKNGYGGAVRRLAVEVVHRGRMTTLAGGIRDMVDDAAEDGGLRRAAARALADVASGDLPILRAWLDLRPGADPDNDFLATALDLLWPDHIDVDVLKGHLRPQAKGNHIGRYQNFLLELPGRLSAVERAIVLDAFADVLEKALCHVQNGRDAFFGRWQEEFHPAQEFGRFLAPQLEEWKNQEGEMPRMERWLALIAKASISALVWGNTTEGVRALIQREHFLRQRLCRRRVERLAAERSEQHDPALSHLWSDLCVPQEEDLEFWEGVVTEWAEWSPLHLEAGWDGFVTAWGKAGYRIDAWDWLGPMTDSEAPKSPALARLWEQRKWCPYDPESESVTWVRKNAKRRRAEEHRWLAEVKHVKSRLQALRDGDTELLVHVWDLHDRRGGDVSLEDWVQSALGSETAEGFRAGLRENWEFNEPPVLPDAYVGSHIPWWAILVLHAIEASRIGDSFGWERIPGAMRQKALLAGLWHLNGLPKWYGAVAQLEPQFAVDLLTRILDIESETEEGYPRFAASMASHGDDPLFRGLAYGYIIDHALVRQQVLVPLLQCVIAKELSDEQFGRLWETAQVRFARGEVAEALRYLAALWRFTTRRVWRWVDQVYLGTGEDRTGRFDQWMGAVESLHLDSLSHIWPEWIPDDALVDMLPDLYGTYPPNSDPDTEVFNRGGREIQRRAEMARLRASALQRLAESGEDLAFEALQGLLQTQALSAYRDSLLNSMDVWRRARAERTWRPLSPEQLWRVLTQGKRPVQTHADLFDLVCEILGDVRADIQGGEVPVKALMWQGRGIEKRPQHERSLQIVIADKIRRHPIVGGQRLVSGRELEVGGNYPDLFAARFLPGGQRAKVYIEVKGQWHEALLKAMSDQLAVKYLSDPEARNGVYLVGWYGPKHYGVSAERLQENCAHKPESAKHLELCLQRLCDTTANGRPDIDRILAMVIDVS